MAGRVIQGMAKLTAAGAGVAMGIEAYVMQRPTTMKGVDLFGMAAAGVLFNHLRRDRSEDEEATNPLGGRAFGLFAQASTGLAAAGSIMAAEGLENPSAVKAAALLGTYAFSNLYIAARRIYGRAPEPDEADAPIDLLKGQHRSA